MWLLWVVLPSLLGLWLIRKCEDFFGPGDLAFKRAEQELREGIDAEKSRISNRCSDYSCACHK